MYYYVVKRIGKGTEADPYHPDIPEGVPFTGVEYKGFFLLGSNVDLPDSTSIKKQVTLQQIETAAVARGYTLNDVLSWFAGDNL